MKKSSQIACNAPENTAHRRSWTKYHTSSSNSAAVPAVIPCGTQICTMLAPMRYTSTALPTRPPPLFYRYFRQKMGKSESSRTAWSRSWRRLPARAVAKPTITSAKTAAFHTSAQNRPPQPQKGDHPQGQMRLQGILQNRQPLFPVAKGTQRVAGIAYAIQMDAARHNERSSVATMAYKTADAPNETQNRYHNHSKPPITSPTSGRTTAPSAWSFLPVTCAPGWQNRVKTRQKAADNAFHSKSSPVRHQNAAHRLGHSVRPVERTVDWPSSVYTAWFRAGRFPRPKNIVRYDHEQTALLFQTVDARQNRVRRSIHSHPFGGNISLANRLDRLRAKCRHSGVAR